MVYPNICRESVIGITLLSWAWLTVRRYWSFNGGEREIGLARWRAFLLLLYLFYFSFCSPLGENHFTETLPASYSISIIASQKHQALSHVHDHHLGPSCTLSLFLIKPRRNQVSEIQAPTCNHHAPFLLYK